MKINLRTESFEETSIENEQHPMIFQTVYLLRAHPIWKIIILLKMKITHYK